ncbi:hypothetical protein BIY27_10915 [Gibbsiella quercinecans]|uniref:hypothetical protein n=1 Tax=Gibbsiella quercinecans TaxID=929813 RepID=UPI000EF1BCE7|nr:hypothetical protein [Gibbsiella quercinecans]RLM13372.1 hypothetical protein BIY27_10915 [Gibbsiella quercinecans]
MLLGISSTILASNAEYRHCMGSNGRSVVRFAGMKLPGIWPFVTGGWRIGLRRYEDNQLIYFPAVGASFLCAG